MRYTRVLLCLSVMVLCILSAGCAGEQVVAGAPITLTIWHVYGEQTDSPLNDLIDEFNRTEGEEKGIRIEVTSVSNTNVIHEAVLAAESGQPGAGKLPDLFVSYPKTVIAMQDSSILVDYRDYLTEEELSAFIPSFLAGYFVNNLLKIITVEFVSIIISAAVSVLFSMLLYFISGMLDFDHSSALSCKRRKGIFFKTGKNANKSA